MPAKLRPAFNVRRRRTARRKRANQPDIHVRPPRSHPQTCSSRRQSALIRFNHVGSTWGNEALISDAVRLPGLHLLQSQIQVIDDLSVLLQGSIELFRRFLQLTLQRVEFIRLLRLDRTRGQAKNQNQIPFHFLIFSSRVNKQSHTGPPLRPKQQRRLSRPNRGKTREWGERAPEEADGWNPATQPPQAEGKRSRGQEESEELSAPWAH